jgi:hypothetical protein
MVNPAQDFDRPMVKNAYGQCVCCGRNSAGYRNTPCTDDCPMYWEEIGIRNPEFHDSWPRADAVAADPSISLLAPQAAPELLEFVGILLAEDDRFQIAIGGNPNAVDEMLGRARAAYAKATA